MRLVISLVFSFAIFAGTTSRADDPPEGSIGVQLKIEEGKIVVVATIEGSPAEKAGIKTGDILVKIDDFKVKDNVEMEDLEPTIKEIVKHKPGEKIKLTIKRDDKEKVIEVTVGKRSEIFKKKD